MCELVSRNTNVYTKGIAFDPKKTLVVAQQAKSDATLVKNPEYKADKLKISDSINQKEGQKPIEIISLVNSNFENDFDKEEDEIQTYTKYTSKLATGVQRVSIGIANIAEFESDSKGLKVLAMTVAGPAAKVVTSSKAFKVTSKFIGNPVITKTAGTLGVFAGGLEIDKGFKELNKGEKSNGTYHLIDGGLNIFGGTSLIMGEKTLASKSAIIGVGLSIGHYGDNSVKELGWFKDENGNSQTVLENLYDKASYIDHSVQESTGNEIIGHVTGITSGIVMLPAAGVIAVSGAVVNVTEKVGNGISSAWNYLNG